MFGVSVTYLTIFLPGINASDRASSRQYSIPTRRVAIGRSSSSTVLVVHRLFACRSIHSGFNGSLLSRREIKTLGAACGGHLRCRESVPPLRRWRNTMTSVWRCSTPNNCGSLWDTPLFRSGLGRQSTPAEASTVLYEACS